MIPLGVLILISLIYFAYDRSLMPPKPIWTSPPYIPGETQGQYAARFLETSEQPNALSHYLKAFSSVTVPENIEITIKTIADKGWNKPYPEVERVLQLNQKALEEVRLGAQMKSCELPPNPYIFTAPTLSWKYARNLARLIIVTGRKLEGEKKYSQALQYYFDGM
ncbi:MAG: hypothetical protein QME64_08925 [bacterium]|nr:hypothetical protein [bacterium]